MSPTTILLFSPMPAGKIAPTLAAPRLATSHFTKVDFTANSGVPLPVAMSSAEAEYMAACAASMQATVARSLLYDIRFLGTLEYKL